MYTASNTKQVDYDSDHGKSMSGERASGRNADRGPLSTLTFGFNEAWVSWTNCTIDRPAAYCTTAGTGAVRHE